jgi:hypothetical protein
MLRQQGGETAKTLSFAPIQGVWGAREGVRERLEGQKLRGQACGEGFQRWNAVKFLEDEVFLD